MSLKRPSPAPDTLPSQMSAAKRQCGGSSPWSSDDDDTISCSAGTSCSESQLQSSCATSSSACSETADQREASSVKVTARRTGIVVGPCKLGGHPAGICTLSGSREYASSSDGSQLLILLRTRAPRMCQSREATIMLRVLGLTALLRVRPQA